MRLREEIKVQAKEAFKENYGVCLGVFVVAMLISFFSAYTGPLAFLIAIPLSLGLICHFTMAGIFGCSFGSSCGRFCL